MEKDLPDFLSDDLSATPAAQGQPAPDASAPAEGQAPAQDAPQAASAAEGAPEGQRRGPDGKFVAAEPTAAPAQAAAPAEPAAQPAPPAQQEAFAPIAALLDERERRQKAEREAEELRTWRQQQEARARAPQVAAPDPARDPVAFQAFQAQQIDDLLYQQGREISRRFAVMQHGEELVKDAFEWGTKRCDEDPHFNAKVRASQDPYGFVVGEFRRDKIASQVTEEDFRAFQEWKAAQQAASAAQAQQPQAQPGAVAPAAAPPPAPAAPRPSIAAAPAAAAAGSPIPMDGAATYDALFT